MSSLIVGLYAALALTELLVGLLFLRHAARTRNLHWSAPRLLLVGIGISWLGAGLAHGWITASRALRLRGENFTWMVDHPVLTWTLLLILCGAAVHLWTATRIRFQARFVLGWTLAMIAVIALVAGLV